jgi:8-oxo-dGTP pyrophosphatase MutT (NUDIX family)
MMAVVAAERSGGRAEVLRGRLVESLAAIEPWDELERAQLAAVTGWVTGGAPLYRTRKPDVPPTHLVSYFVVVDAERGTLLLGAHRKAGLWLPAGGHVEPGEDPWETVLRECREELGIEAVPAAVSGDRPFFLTATRTRGHGQHTDVALWYVLRGREEDVTSFDEGEFAAVRWLSPERVLAEPVDTLDPHQHRFVGKLTVAAGGTLGG